VIELQCPNCNRHTFPLEWKDIAEIVQCPVCGVRWIVMYDETHTEDDMYPEWWLEQATSRVEED